MMASGEVKKERSGREDGDNKNSMATKEGTREWSGQDESDHQDRMASTADVKERHQKRSGQERSGQDDNQDIEDMVEPHFSLVQYEAPRR